MLQGGDAGVDGQRVQKGDLKDGHEVRDKAEEVVEEL